MDKNPVMLPMNEISTLNQLVLYLYNETRLTDTVMVQQSIDTDPEIAEIYHDLITANQLISSQLLSPSEKSVNAILNYSRLTAAPFHS